MGGFHGDCSEMAYGDGAVADFCGGGGLGASADAVEEICFVVVAFVEVDFVGADDRIQD